MATTNEGFIGATPLPSGSVAGGGGGSWSAPTVAPTTTSTSAMPVAIATPEKAVSNYNQNVSTLNQYTQNVATQKQTVEQQRQADLQAQAQKLIEEQNARTAAAEAAKAAAPKAPTAAETASELLKTLGVQEPTAPTPVVAETAPSTYEQQRMEAAKDLDASLQKAHQEFQAATQQMLTGTFPLNQDQQNQLSNLQQQFEGLKRQQMTANENFKTGITQLGIAAGRSRYAPEVELGNIQSAVNLGLSKIAEIDQKMSDAMNTMKRAFQTDNYKLLKDSHDELQQYEQDKYARISDLAKDIQSRKEALEQHNLEIQKENQARQETLDKNLAGLMQTARGAGADETTIANIAKAKSLTEAIQVGGKFVEDSASALNAQIKQAQLEKTQAQTAKLTGTTASAAASLGLDDASINFYAQSVAAGGQMPTLGMGANAVLVKAAIMNQAAKIAIDSGMTGNAYVLKQKALAANSSALAQQVKQASATKTAEKKASYTLDLALQVAPKVWRSGIPIVNRFEQYYIGKDLTGDPALTQFENHIYEAALDYAKVISGSAASVAGLTDSARKEAETLISASMNPEQFKAAVEAMKQNMAVTNQSYEDTINDLKYEVMGLENVLPSAPVEQTYSSGSYTPPSLNNITNPADAF